MLGGLHPARSFPSPAARLASPLSRHAAAARRVPARRGLRSQEATPQGASPRARGAVAVPPPAPASTTPGVPRPAPVPPLPPSVPPSRAERCRAPGQGSQPPPAAPQSAQRPLPAAFSSSSSGALGRSRSIGAGPGREMRKRSGAPSRGAPPALPSPSLPSPPAASSGGSAPPGRAGPAPRPGAGSAQLGAEGGPRSELLARQGPAAGRRAHPRTCCASSASLQAWLSFAGKISNEKPAVQQNGDCAPGTGQSARTADGLGQVLSTTPERCLPPCCEEEKVAAAANPGKAALQDLQSLMAVPLFQDKANHHWSL